MASQEALGAPAEAPKTVEAAVDQPVAAAPVEPLVVPVVVVEKKVEAVAAPVKKSVVIKKKSKS
jgi:hypothetical protein